MVSIQAVLYHAVVIKNIGNKQEKLAYISKLPPNVQQFLGSNIQKVGIGPELFNEITIGQPSSSLEYLIITMNVELIQLTKTFHRLFMSCFSFGINCN